MVRCVEGFRFRSACAVSPLLAMANMKGVVSLFGTEQLLTTLVPLLHQSVACDEENLSERPLSVVG